MPCKPTCQDLDRSMEDALRVSEERHRAILRAAMDGIWRADIQGRLMEVNDAYCRMSGYSQDELLAMSVSDLEAAETPADIVAHIEKIRVQGGDRFESRHRRKDGSLFDVEVSVQYRPEEGEGTVAFLRDITWRKRQEEALRESEARYRSLVEQIPAVTYTAALDEASTTIYVSPQIEGMIGFTPAEYSEDPDIWRKQLHPQDRARVLAEVARSRACGIPFGTEYRMLHRDGHVVWLRDEAVFVRDSLGAPLYLQGVMFDISGIKQAEERIHDLSQELMKAHEMERRMISFELHDRVAQDLSMVKIGVDSLVYSGPEASTETRNRVIALSRTMQRTINAVRDLAYDLRPPILDQLGLVQSIYQYCEEFSEKEGLMVDFNCAGIDELNLDADTEINLYRLVQEGLINVKKHAEATRVGLRLVASFPKIILRITDNGKGFDVEERRRSLNSEKRMGLRSMEERVRWLGGFMEIKSSPGQGTRIVIQVPHKEKRGGAEKESVDRG